MQLKLKRNDKAIKFFPDRDITVTWNMLYNESTRWGAWIKKNNISFLGICMGNRPEFLYAFTGALRVGVKVLLIPIGTEVTLPDGCVEIYDDTNKHIKGQTGIKLSEIELVDGEFTDYDWGKNETAIVMFTSGTSGERKLIENSLSHYANELLFNFFKFAFKLKKITVFNTSPWYHNTGSFALVYCLLGISFLEITIDSFNPVKVKKALLDNEPLLFIGTSTMLHRIILCNNEKTYIPHFVLALGEKVYPHVLKQLTKYKSFKFLYSSYGTTEVGAVTSFICENPSNSFLYNLLGKILINANKNSRLYTPEEITDGFAGEISVHADVKIEDADSDGCGKILVNTKTKAVSIKEKYYMTGDLGLIKDNKLYIKGRISNVINHSGEKICSEDVEKAVLKLPDIKEAYAFAVPSDTHGESVGLAVVGKASEEKIKSVLPKFAHPKQIIFMDAFPLNSSQKRDDQKIKEYAASIRKDNLHD